MVSCRDAALMASVLPPETSFFEFERSSSALHNFRFKYPNYDCISQKTKQPSGCRAAVLNKQNETKHPPPKLGFITKCWHESFVKLHQCFPTFVRPRHGKFFFHKTRARSQQIYSSVPFQFFLKVLTLN